MSIKSTFINALTSFGKKAVTFFRREEPQLASTAAKIDVPGTLSALKVSSFDDGLAASRAMKELATDPNASIDQIKRQAMGVLQAPASVKTNFSASMTNSLYEARSHATDPARIKQLDALIGANHIDLKRNIVGRTAGGVPHDMAQATATNNLRDAEALLKTGAISDLRKFASDTVAHNLEELNRVNPQLAYQRLSDFAKLPEFDDIKKAMGKDSELLNNPAPVRDIPLVRPDVTATVAPKAYGLNFDEAMSASRAIKTMTTNGEPAADIAPKVLSVFNSSQKSNFASQVTHDLYKAKLQATDPAEARKLGTLVESGHLRLKQNLQDRASTVVPHGMEQATATNNLRDAGTLLQTGAKGELRDLANKAIAQNLDSLHSINPQLAQQQLAKLVESPQHLDELRKAMGHKSEVLAFAETPAGMLKWINQSMDQMPSQLGKEAWVKYAMQNVDEVGSYTKPLQGNLLPHDVLGQIASKANLSPETDQAVAKIWKEVNQDLARTRPDLAQASARELANTAPAGSQLARASHSEILSTNNLPKPTPVTAATESLRPSQMIDVPASPARAFGLPAAERQLSDVEVFSALEQGFGRAGSPVAGSFQAAAQPRSGGLAFPVLDDVVPLPAARDVRNIKLDGGAVETGTLDMSADMFRTLFGKADQPAAATVTRAATAKLD